MAISSNPSRDEIYNFFSSNSKPSANGLKEMHNKVFGSGLYSRDAFGGLDKPFGLDTQPVTSITDDSAQFNGELAGSGGVECWVYFEYSTTSDFSSNVQSTSHQNKSAGTNIGVLAGVSGLSDGTTYYVRLVAYNKFNDHSSNHIKASFDVESFTTTLSCPIPTGIFVTADFSGFDVSWNSMSGANSYDLQCSVNSGSFFTVATGITGTSYNHEGCNSAFNNGDMVRYRVRTNCSGGSSPYSSPTTAEEASCF